MSRRLRRRIAHRVARRALRARLYNVSTRHVYALWRPGHGFVRYVTALELATFGSSLRWLNEILAEERL